MSKLSILDYSSTIANPIHGSSVDVQSNFGSRIIFPPCFLITFQSCSLARPIHGSSGSNYVSRITFPPCSLAQSIHGSSVNLQGNYIPFPPCSLASPIHGSSVDVQRYSDCPWIKENSLWQYWTSLGIIV